MPKAIIDQVRCKACGLCVAFCPKGNIKMSDAVDERGYHYAVIDDEGICTGCKLCAVVCPEAAVTILRERATPKEDGAE